jgi:hypothetical protein
VSIDLQIVFPQESVHLNRVRTLPGSGRGVVPRTLDITGDDFTSVEEVLINNIESPDVIILSKNRLLAQVPEHLAVSALGSVTVLSKRLTLTDRSLIRFRIGKTPGKVRGILRLVQLFLKILFTTPGSDIFNRKTGGGGLIPLGQTFGGDDGGGIVSGFIISIDQTSRQIVAIQGRDPSTPRDERLLSAKVLTASFNRNEAALVVGIEITSQAGRAALANLEL